MSRSLSAALVALTSLAGAAAHAETVNCTPINTVPFVISSPGVYCLTTDLESWLTAGAAIDVTSDEVTVDLNGHTLRHNDYSTALRVVGIRGLNRMRVTVRNGNITGFGWGIRLASSSASLGGHLVEEVRAYNNRAVGIEIAGWGSVARHNQVISTGRIQGEAGWSAAFYLANTQGARVVDNDVQDVTQNGSPSYGVWINGGSSALVVGNRIVKAVYGIYYDAAATGKYRDNIVSETIGAAYTGGTNAGNNQ